MKTLNTQYQLIKEGKGHKDVFLKEAKQLFPNYITNSTNFNEASKILKQKGVINESIVGITAVNTIESKKEPYETAFENFLKEAKVKEETDKAEVKKPAKQVEEKEKTTSKPTDKKEDKNFDNMIFDQIMTGYYTEMKDPKNADKTMEQLKDIVLKNLQKDSIHYVKAGQFGVKGLGYTTEHPGLGTPKEPKGKYKSSGYGDLKEGIGKNYPDEISGEYEGSTQKFQGVDLYDFLKDMLELSNSENDFVNKVTYGLTDGTSSLSTEDIQKLRRWYAKNSIESLKESKLRKVIRESIEKELATINKEAELEVLAAKLDKIEALIQKRQSQLSKLDEDEDMKNLTDAKKVKGIEKEIKTLEKAKSKVEKILGKSKGKKKEVIDEVGEENTYEVADEAPDDFKAAIDNAEQLYDELGNIEDTLDQVPDQYKKEVERHLRGAYGM